MSIIERVKAEQVIDVFQAAKLLRVKRPGAVETLVRETSNSYFQTILKELDLYNILPILEGKKYYLQLQCYYDVADVILT